MYCTFNTHFVTLVGTVGIFSAASMSVFASWHHRSKKINTGRKEYNFLSELWVQDEVSQLTVTRIVAGKSKFITVKAPFNYKDDVF